MVTFHRHFEGTSLGTISGKANSWRPSASAMSQATMETALVHRSQGIRGRGSTTWGSLYQKKSASKPRPNNFQKSWNFRTSCNFPTKCWTIWIWPSLTLYFLPPKSGFCPSPWPRLGVGRRVFGLSQVLRAPAAGEHGPLLTEVVHQAWPKWQLFRNRFGMKT